MEILNSTKADFGQIVNEILDFWDSDRTAGIHHPMFIYEFGNTAFVIKDNERVIAYLFAFFSQTEKAGYIHLIGVGKSYQGKGLGRLLYENFETIARRHGCSKLKAITSASNQASILFHNKIRMKLLGEKNANGINVVKDYSAFGQDRVVFEKTNNHFYVSLENLTQGDDDHPYEPVEDFDPLDLEGLESLFIKHLRIRLQTRNKMFHE